MKKNVKINNLNIKKFILSFFLLLFFIQIIPANSAPRYSTNLKNIAQQILLLTDQGVVLNNKIKQLNAEQEQFKQNPPATYQEASQLKNQITMRMKMINMLVDELTQSLNNTQQRGARLAELQKDTQVKLLNEQVLEEKNKLTQWLHYTVELTDLNQKENNLLFTNLALAKKLEDMYRQYLSDCLALLESIDKQQTIQKLRQQVEAEQKQTDQWLGKMNELNQKKGTNKKELLADQIINESHLFYYTQQIHLSSIKIIVLEAAIYEQKIVEVFKNLNQNVNNNTKTEELKQKLDGENNRLQEALDTLEQYQQLMKKQDDLLQNAVKNNWLNTQSAESLKLSLNELEKTAANIQKVLIEKQKIVQNNQLKLQEYMTEMVAKRQALLKTDEKLGLNFLNQIAGLPKLLMMYFMGLWEQVWHGIVLASFGIRLLIGAILLSGSLIWWFGRKYFRILSEKMAKNRQRTASNMVYILSELFRRNWACLCLFFSIGLVLSLSGINFGAYLGLFYTALIWFLFRIIMGIARIILVERGSDTQGHDVRLYHRLKWVFIVGGWVTVLVVLSKQFDMGSEVSDISNRLFMAFLLTVSIVLIRARHVIPNMLDPVFASRKYLSRAIRAVCWFLPLGLLISTILGLLGYVNLSWILIYYQAALLVIIAGYMILRGIASDLFEISSEFMIRSLNQGWLWSEAFLKPVDRLFRIFLFVSMIVGIFLVLGWGDDSLVVTKMREIFEYPFFYFSGINVTLFSILELIALISFCFWSAKWTREFSYRWVFRNARDVGIRNSLAVFCQYIVITLGTIITLRTLGIDFTGLSMILGGLAVGLGFGLRDFASNIVGGIMLLIERSVKEGDIVSIGNYEGEVTHIGIRAMRIRSWDHMEIMVPNSEILMKTFMNWTHQDSVVRTVIPMKIHRVDDPYSVQKMILDLLKDIPEILPEPEPQVFFTNMNDALIEFEIRYFINISLQNRPEIRSKVVLIILETFQKIGIRPPYAQQDSYVWEVHHEATDEKKEGSNKSKKVAHGL